MNRRTQMRQLTLALLATLVLLLGQALPGMAAGRGALPTPQSCCVEIGLTIQVQGEQATLKGFMTIQEWQEGLADGGPERNAPAYTARADCAPSRALPSWQRLSDLARRCGSVAQRLVQAGLSFVELGLGSGPLFGMAD